MKNFKNFMALLLLCTTVFSSINIYSVYADEQIKIYIDGENLITDDTPYLSNGRTLVPFRAIFEKLGFEVSWVAEGKQINAERRTSKNRVRCNIQTIENRMVVTFDDYVTESSGFVNDTSFEIPPQIVNGKTYIPLRAVSEALGCKVDWNSNTKTITIIAKDKLPTKKEVEDNSVITPNVAEAVTEETTSNNVITEPEQQADVVIYSDDNKPVVGDTPGNILKDPNDPNHYSADKYTDSYRYGSIGVCAWYADSRFCEVTGIKLYLYQLGGIKECLTNAAKHNDLKVITDINSIQNNVIAVFIPKVSTMVGHEVYVEYVERDSNGTPNNIYFTETNGYNTLNKNEFDLGYDGIVQKMTFEDFKKRSPNLELAGYIAANK